MVPKAEAAPLYVAPMVIRDGQEPRIHPATGEIVDSKSKMRQITRDSGCIEVGTSEFPKPAMRSGDLVRDVGKAYQMVRDGYRPDPRVVPGAPGGGGGWHE
jgi:hypothetical protein